MNLLRGYRTEGGSRRRDLRGTSTQRIALVLLLAGGGFGLMATALVEGLPAGGIAHADGGSTIPIPPPSPPASQEIGPMPTRTATPSTNLVELDLGNIHLGTGARIETRGGTAISLTGTRIRLETDSLGDQRMVLPFVLAPGQELQVLEEEASGIAWQPASSEAGGGELLLGLAGRRVPGGLTVELGPLQSNGDQTWAPVLRADLYLGPVELEELGSSIGSVQLSAQLQRLPSNIALDLHTVTPDSGMVTALSEASRDLNMGIASLAYAAEVETGLTDEVAEAVMEMTVTEDWTAAWSQDRVRIGRIGEGRSRRILETTFTGEDPMGRARFRAESPGGFSTFMLIALGELTAGNPSNDRSGTLGFAIGVGALAVVGFSVGAYLLFVSQRQIPSA